MKAKEDEVLSTGQVAKLLRCSQQTVIRSFDSGKLVGWKTPGGSFRRILLSTVEKFAKDNNIPLDRNYKRKK